MLSAIKIPHVFVPLNLRLCLNSFIISPLPDFGMDFLKSAVASAISTTKGPFPGFTFGDRQDIDQSIWTLQNGTRKVIKRSPPSDEGLLKLGSGGWVKLQHILIRCYRK